LMNDSNIHSLSRTPEASSFTRSDVDHDAAGP
jgi:hypothetical protein